jgi:hypothetical protein
MVTPSLLSENAIACPSMNFMLNRETTASIVEDCQVKLAKAR